MRKAEIVQQLIQDRPRSAIARGWVWKCYGHARLFSVCEAAFAVEGVGA